MNGNRSALGLGLVALTGIVLSWLGLAEAAAPVGSTQHASRSASTATADRRMNIVVVMADDMRADDLRFAPHLRALARQRGLDFRNSFSPNPLCCPARASFLTGRYSHNHRIYWHESPWGYGAFDDSRTLATALDAVGYQTGYVGKYLNRYGLAQSRVSGRPSYRYVPAGWDDWVGALDGRSSHYPGSTYDYFHTSYNHNGEVETHREYGTLTIARYARRLIRLYQGRAAPFFLSVNFVAPHHGGFEADDPGPVVRADGRVQEFPTPQRPGWIRGHWDHVVKHASGMPRDGGPAEARVADKPPALRRLPGINAAERLALRDVTRQRAESITVMDRAIRGILHELRVTGAWDETVFLFTSDNGYFLGEHRIRSGKVRAHEPSLRVPLVATGPGAMREGRAVHEPVTTIDLAATVLDIGNGAPPRRPDGRSLLPTMLHGDRGWTVPVVTEAAFTSRGEARGFHDARGSIGLRTARYSYTRYRDGFEELYDLAADPLQNQNCSRSPRCRAALLDLRRLWWRFKDCAGATCRKPLPESLATTASQTRLLTRSWWRAVRHAYGFA